VTSDKFCLVKVCARFFAQLRDLAGAESFAVDLPDGANVGDLLDNIYRRFPALRAHDKAILAGAGVEFVDRKYKLKPGDEIAIMPPVQGG
jgi:MoaD family protein